MAQTGTVKVSRRYQIALPSTARQRLKIQAGDRLLVDIQDGMLILMPQPKDFVETMTGFHKDVWVGVDTTRYLSEERDAWEPSNND